MIARAERVRQLEEASEGLATMAQQRDAAAEQLREQIAENGRLREQIDGLKAVAEANRARDAELAQLANIIRETGLQLSQKIGGA